VKKEKKSYMKTVMTFMFIFLFLFVCVCLYITYKTSSEPSALIASVFAFCTVEGGLGAWIKTTKVKQKKSKNEDVEN
jgi:phosphotransferase system  glucose/maltose/N-acetylglucosamine-specific IIC component